MEKQVNPQEHLIRSAKGASQQEGFSFEWRGERVPERLIIADPSDPDGKKMLVDEEVGYMRDGMIMSRDGKMLGTYDRTIDFQKQPDGSYRNQISFHPVDPDTFMSNLLSGRGK